MNTVIAGSTAGVVAVYIKPHFLGTYSFVNRYDCCALCNGVLTGLVAVSGVCDRIEGWTSFVIGIIGAISYVLGCKVLDTLHVDDPVEAAPVHLFGGLVGTLLTGVFDNRFGLISSSQDKGSYFGF